MIMFRFNNQILINRAICIALVVKMGLCIFSASPILYIFHLGLEKTTLLIMPLSSGSLSELLWLGAKELLRVIDEDVEIF